jgi:hypothetical protein
MQPAKKRVIMARISVVYGLAKLECCHLVPELRAVENERLFCLMNKMLIQPDPIERKQRWPTNFG